MGLDSMVSGCEEASWPRLQIRTPRGVSGTVLLDGHSCARAKPQSVAAQRLETDEVKRMNLPPDYVFAGVSGNSKELARTGRGFIAGVPAVVYFYVHRAGGAV